MKPARISPQVSRRFSRLEGSHCPDCQKRQRRAVTVSERTVVTRQEVITWVHAGDRCPHAQCVGRQRTYRSARADVLALPRFTSGMDVVLLVGRLRLVEYRELHREWLAPRDVTIARREVLSL